MSVLLLLPRSLFIGELLSSADDESSSVKVFSLFRAVLFEGGKGERTSGESGGNGRSVGRDDVEGGVESSRESSEMSSEKSRGGGLEIVLGSRGDRSGVRSKEILVKLDRSRSVIDSDVQISSSTSFRHESLDSHSGDLLLSVADVSGKLDNSVDLERSVDLSELLEKSSENDVLERFDVAGGLRVLLERGENRLDLGGDGERVEVDLEDVVERSKFGADSFENMSVELLPIRRVSDSHEHSTRD